MIPGETIDKLINLLYPFDYSITGIHNDLSCEILQTILPFKVSSYPTGTELNGWVVPRAWRLNYLRVFKDGKLLFEFTDHPFCVPKNTISIDVDNLSYQELIGRINRSVTGYSDDFVYDWRNLYRNSPLDWSLCLTEDMISQLAEGSVYRVAIDSTFYDSALKVLEFDTHPDIETTIVVNAHNCHPYQANDDISGIVAGILLAQLWAKELEPRFNLRLLIAPELYGPMFYLDSLGENGNFLGAVLLKGIGNSGTLKLQQSVQESSLVSEVATRLFHEKDSSNLIHSFRTLYGNDEIVFENPPYCIPTITLTRIPFTEYHNSSDIPARISTASVIQTIEVAHQILKACNGNTAYHWASKGLPKLSDLTQGLYKPTRAQGIHNLGDGEIEKRWHVLMNCLPALVHQGADALFLSKKFDLPLLEIIEYVAKWEAAGFLKKTKDELK